MPRRHCRSPVFLGSLIDFGMVLDINHRNVCLHASHPRCWNTGKSPVRLTSRLKLARKGRAVSLCQDLNPESNWSLLPRETSVLFILVVDRSGFIQFWERPRSFEESVKLCFDDAAMRRRHQQPVTVFVALIEFFVADRPQFRRFTGQERLKPASIADGYQKWSLAP